MLQTTLFDTESGVHHERPALSDADFLAGIPNIERVKNRHYESFDVYIGRGTLWGNPFKLGAKGDRLDAIMRYKQHLWGCLKDGRITRQDLLGLQGKTLGCSCAPRPCHGHVLLCAVAWVETLA